jgi:hypothetical protein
VSTRTGSLIDRRNWEPENYWFRQGMAIGWYDRGQRLWTVYRIDADGNQVSGTRYYAKAEHLVADQPNIAHLGSMCWEGVDSVNEV